VVSTASTWIRPVPPNAVITHSPRNGPLETGPTLTDARAPSASTRSVFPSVREMKLRCGREAGESKKTLKTLIPGGVGGGFTREPTTTKTVGSTWLASVRVCPEAASTIETCSNSGIPGRRSSTSRPESLPLIGHASVARSASTRTSARDSDSPRAIDVASQASTRQHPTLVVSGEFMAKFSKAVGGGFSRTAPG
jgi:hypothetical protein